MCYGLWDFGQCVREYATWGGEKQTARETLKREIKIMIIANARGIVNIPRDRIIGITG